MYRSFTLIASYGLILEFLMFLDLFLWVCDYFFSLHFAQAVLYYSWIHSFSYEHVDDDRSLLKHTQFIKHKNTVKHLED